ncbi:amidase [Solirubrobacter taibaiensis]|nr:amidase [Solirubrobacter taibaiensis]
MSGALFSVKDNIEVAGWPLSLGVHEDAPVSLRTAVSVQRLLDAGAALIGKTNLPPYGGGIETENEVFGRTSNPYDRTRTVGGSSGGEAAAVASGASRFGLGTDSGASVRLPAHCCGLAALKPTAGRVPIDGVIDDLGPIGAMRDPRTQIGVLARTVADVELVLSVISDRPGTGVSSASRVGLWLEDDVCAETAAVMRAAADVLGAQAVTVPEGGHAVTVSIWQSYGDGAIAYDTLGRWDALRAEWRRFGGQFDVILSPVFPTPAPPHGELASAPDRTHYTNVFNLTGWPAATVRCGTGADGMPIGVQVAARPWEDEVALAAAGVLERALGGYVAP